MTFRLLKLTFSWFRGASTDFHFEPNGKNVVIFGPNGSGKSSIVDALEYLLTAGTVEHLKGEYSGRRYERSVPNTKLPVGLFPSVKLTMHGGIEASATVQTNNAPACFGVDKLSYWSATRSLIRQERLSAFVVAGKTNKYEAILPMLGLAPLETCAANVRALKNKVMTVSKLKELQGELKSLKQARQSNFPNMSGAQIAGTVRELEARYLVKQSVLTDLKSVTDAVTAAIVLESSKRDEASNIQILLGQARDAKLQTHLDTATLLAHEAAVTTQPFLQERLTILQATDAFCAVLPESRQPIDCPACGRRIPFEDFAEHVQREMTRLNSALEMFNKRSAALQNVVDALKATQTPLRSPRMSQIWLFREWALWKTEIDDLLGFDPESLVGTDQADALVRLQRLAGILIPQITKAADKVAPSTKTLIDDSSKAKSAGDWGRAKPLDEEVKAVSDLVTFLEKLEEQLRDAIREQATSVLKDISDEVAEMWLILHPDHPIDGVHLYQHADSERAIDIGVRFHGRDQLSPTLTLSEGYRNALGLCVLLALAKCGDPAPIVLDDVVTSFDREHRAGVVDLITQKLTGHQVILLTHESDWFAQLNLCLPGKEWEFKSLRPYVNPEVGVRWDEQHEDFREARKLLDDHPSTACAKARAIMDHQACIIADRLHISLTYILGARNDRRTAREIMERIAAEGAKSFRTRDVDGCYQAVPHLADAARAVSALLPAYSNTPAHGGYGSRAEGLKLIEAGEALMTVLKCISCKSLVTTYSDRSGHKSQCSCGSLQWKS